MVKIWTISLDGNDLAREQVQSLAQALADKSGVGATIESFFPRVPSPALKLSHDTLQTWTQALTSAQLKTLACNGPMFSDISPDFVVACQPEVAAVALGVKQASNGRTKLVQIHSPNDPTQTYDFPLSQFDVIISQKLKDAFGKEDALDRLLAAPGEAFAMVAQGSTSRFVCFDKLGAALKQNPLCSMVEAWAKNAQLQDNAKKSSTQPLVRQGLATTSSH